MLNTFGNMIIIVKLTKLRLYGGPGSAVYGKPTNVCTDRGVCNTIELIVMAIMLYHLGKGGG